MKTPHRSFIVPLLLLGGIISAAVWFRHRAFNPPDINHLVLIRELPGSNSPPFQATLEGDITWTQQLAFHGGHGPNGRERALALADIHNPWFSGELTINDQDGVRLARVSVSPPGRYCGTLVIHLTKEGNSHTAWNQLPVVDDSE